MHYIAVIYDHPTGQVIRVALYGLKKQTHVYIFSLMKTSETVLTLFNFILILFVFKIKMKKNKLS